MPDITTPQERIGTFQAVEGGIGIPATYRYSFTLPNGQQKYGQQKYIIQQVPYNETPAAIQIIENTLENMARQEIQNYVQIQTQYAPIPTNWINNTTTANQTANPQNYVWQTAWDNAWDNENPPYPGSVPQSFIDGYIAGQKLSGIAQDAFRSVLVKFKLGKHTLIISKKISEVDECLEITDEDIARAKKEYFDRARVNIITRKAENKAEDLLRMFISEVDFRSYKQNGFFTIKSSDKIFRIYKDSHRHIDMYEHDKERGLFVPKNRLCVHTEKRSLPAADEALSKLLLIRSGKIIEEANLHSITNEMKEMNEKELVLC